MLQKKDFLLVLFAVFMAFFMVNISTAATSVTQSTGTQDSGVKGIPSLPGTEISPQEMQKRFPAPLGGSAPALPFLPDAAPLMPALPLNKADSENKQEESTKHSVPSVKIPTPPVLSPSATPSGQSVEQRQAQKNLLQEHFSRALGTGTAPTGSSEENPLGKALISIAPKPTGFPTLEVMLGQMVMAGFTGTELETQSPIVLLIKAGKVGGIFLEPRAHKVSNAQTQPLLAMAQSGLSAQVSAEKLAQVGLAGNIVSPSQTRQLIALLQSYVPQNVPPLWIAVEQEGGTVQALRKDLGFEGLASAAHLGQGSVENTEIAARRAGLEMGGLGINFAFGPAGDVNVNPLSESIGARFRSFNMDAQRVATHVMAFGRGLLAANVLPCLRNFPGTGSYVRGFALPVSGASGVNNILESIPDISGTWQQRELTPYKESVSQNLGLVQKQGQNRPLWGIQPALVYHRVLDALRPVPLSPAALTGILRTKWAFQGLIVSQDLGALQPFFSLEDSILYSVQSGADILLVTQPPTLVNPAQSPLAGLGGLSSLAGLVGGDGVDMEQLAGLLDNGTLNSMKQGEAGLDESALIEMFLNNGAGKMLPGGLGSLPGFGAQVKAKPLTGIASQAEMVFAALLKLVQTGRISEARVRASWLRIMEAKRQLGLNAL